MDIPGVALSRDKWLVVLSKNAVNLRNFFNSVFGILKCKTTDIEGELYFLSLKLWFSTL